MDLVLLQREVLVLRKRIEWLVALFRLMVVLLKVTDVSYRKVQNVPTNSTALTHGYSRSAIRAGDCVDDRDLSPSTSRFARLALECSPTGDHNRSGH